MHTSWYACMCKHTRVGRFDGMLTLPETFLQLDALKSLLRHSEAFWGKLNQIKDAKGRQKV